MPSTCCVPGCKSNYGKSENVKVFLFPKDSERRKEWIRKIPRKDWEPGPKSVVCIKHFKDEHVLKEDVVLRPDGSILRVARTNFKLAVDANPLIFPNLPKYLSNETETKKRAAPSLRHEKELSRRETEIDDFLSSDLITCFDDIKHKNIERPLWHIVCEAERIVYYKLNVSSMPIIVSSSFLIHPNMTIEIFLNQRRKKNIEWSWLFEENRTKELVVTRWSQLENLLSYIDNNEGTCVLRIEDIVENIDALLDQNGVEYDDDVQLRVKFLAEQLMLCSVKPKGRRYSPELLAWSYAFHIKSPICYRAIYDSGFLCIPHERKFGKLSVHLGVQDSIDSLEKSTFLSAKAGKLEPHELLVNLLLDEIIIQPMVNYVSGSLSGFSANKPLERANSVQCFMITSLYSSNKDVVALFPVKNQTAKDLLHLTLNVISTVLNSGFRIVSIISDNNRINRNMFKELCGGELKTYFFCSAKEKEHNNPTFVLFDSVHILKSLRNNWINQTTEKTTFCFPDPDNLTKTLSASFDDLRDLHEKQKKEIIKVAHRLNDTALYPSNIERQNVSLCLRIFDPSNAAAFSLMGDEKYEGIIKFINIITKWWSIVNVKNSRKGYKKRNQNSAPISDFHDERLQFLLNCKEWLEAWQSLKSGGKLSRDTFCSFQHTLLALHDLIVHLIEVKNDKFVLTGKFQTDSLEGRFGQYRQLNGGNFTISVEQVLKSEKKLRISSLLNLHSNDYGTIPITEFLMDFSDEPTETYDNHGLELKGFDLPLDYEEQQAIPMFIYVSGFAVHQLKKKIQCISCYKMLESDKDLVLDESDSSITKYFTLIDRGGLTYPTEYIAAVFIKCFRIFKCMLKDFESVLQKKNVKSVLMSLASAEISDLDAGDCCSACGCEKRALGTKCISTFFNIFLKNYSNAKNDDPCSARKKRHIFGKK